LDPLPITLVAERVEARIILRPFQGFLVAVALDVGLEAPPMVTKTSRRGAASSPYAGIWRPVRTCQGFVVVALDVGLEAPPMVTKTSRQGELLHPTLMYGALSALLLSLFMAAFRW
jgi:hypothetical protein